MVKSGEAEAVPNNADWTMKSGDLTNKNADWTMKSGDLTNKNADWTMKSGDFNQQKCWLNHEKVVI